jgi:hypothetical protein
MQSTAWIGHCRVQANIFVKDPAYHPPGFIEKGRRKLDRFIYTLASWVKYYVTPVLIGAQPGRISSLIIKIFTKKSSYPGRKTAGSMHISVWALRFAQPYKSSVIATLLVDWRDYTVLIQACNTVVFCSFAMVAGCNLKHHADSRIKHQSRTDVPSCQNTSPRNLWGSYRLDAFGPSQTICWILQVFCVEKYEMKNPDKVHKYESYQIFWFQSVNFKITRCWHFKCSIIDSSRLFHFALKWFPGPDNGWR